MNDKLQDYLALQRERNDLVRRQDRLDGIESESVRKLKEFGASNLEEAEGKLKGMEKDFEAAGKKFRKLEESFREKWKGKI